MPNIGISIGVYLEGLRRANFFASGDGDDRTLYHEATHQLFHESRPVDPNVGRKTNFWIIEGIAMFMENAPSGGRLLYVLGGFETSGCTPRKVRWMRDHLYVPLGEFVDTAWSRCKRIPDRPTLHPGCRPDPLPGLFRRRPLPRCTGGLSAAVYSGRDDHKTLARLTGAENYEELDKEYHKFIEEGI